MAKRIGTIRRKSRHKFTKTLRTKGKISISAYLQNFKEGDKVCLSTEPAYQNGMYHPKYLGKVGKIKGKKGRCFEVSINDQGKEKKL